MTRVSKTEYAVFFGLLVLGVALRWQFQYLPNFAPVAAMALFAGYFFRSAWQALALPLLIMLVSDALMETGGAYHPALMASVYGMLCLPIALRGPLRRRMVPMQGDVSIARRGGSMLGLIACGLGCSVAFFLVTNFMTWSVGGIYPRTWEGLTRCYVQAIPFFRYTALGDLIFATALFGGYSILGAFAQRSQSKLANNPV